MKITWLGTGLAFTMRNYQTNILISRNDKHFLIDAGMDIRWALQEQKLSYKDIDALFITHLHADHAAGVEWIAFTSYFDPTCEYHIQLFGNNTLLRKGWDTTWKGGLESIQGKVMTLNDYFDVTMVRDNEMFVWEDITFEIVQTVHVMNGYAIVPSYGLMLTDPDTNKKIFITSDTQFNPNQLKDFYTNADLIIHDCETTPFSSGVHANYSELRTLDDKIKGKMLLIHYQDNILSPDNNTIINDEWWKKIEEDRFSMGFAVKGNSLKTEKLWENELLKPTKSINT